MGKIHRYSLQLDWTGNKGTGTSDYRSYDRSHTISARNKPFIHASSDPAFRGDSTKYNPEEMLVASLSSCHMLWFLHLCADHGVVVIDYTDHPTGEMEEIESGAGRFKEVCLHPLVTVKGNVDKETLDMLHLRAHELCFIANSVNFDVKCEGRINGEISIT